MTPDRRRTSLLESFNHAFQGFVDAVRHQRNMRVHMVVALLVLVASILLNVTRLELVAVFMAITFVFLAELVNSAVEMVVDMVTDEFDPRAKRAKDVAAAAVLLAAINALVVGYLVLADRVAQFSLQLFTTIRRTPAHLTLVALALVILLVIIAKALQKRGTPLSGGLPSGHAAVAFAGWTAVTFMAVGSAQGVLISAITFIVAVLAAQSRIQAGIHSLFEVVSGALLGAVVTTLIFQLWS